MSILKGNSASVANYLVEKIKRLDPLTYDEMDYLVQGINLYKVKDAGELRVLEVNYKEMLEMPLYNNFKKRYETW